MTVQQHPRVEKNHTAVNDKGCAATETSDGAAPAGLVVTRLTPTKGWTPLDLAGLWEYRELLYFLIWRDVKVRYKRTVLGAAWAVIQPFFTMVVFTLFFGTLAKLAKDVQVPYPIFAYAGLLPWQFFASGLGQSATSLLSQRSTITKIYFP